MAIDRTDKAERLVCLERMIEEYRAARRRRLLRRATKLWRKAEARQRFARFEVPPERVH